MNIQTAIQWQSKNKLFVSLATKPGKTGETFYKILFDYYKVNAEYVACKCDNIYEDMILAKRLCAGASVTMPYKEEVSKYIDSWECRYGITNTIKFNNNKAVAYNCDYLGLKDLLSGLIKNKTIVLLGDGAMSKNVLHLAENTAEVKQFSRKLGNWEQRHIDCDILINTTSIGMEPDKCPVESVNAELVVDCVIGPTVLTKLAKYKITGADIYKAQLKHQFRIYTDIDPAKDLIDKIGESIFNYD